MYCFSCFLFPHCFSNASDFQLYYNCVFSKLMNHLWDKKGFWIFSKSNKPSPLLLWILHIYTAHAPHPASLYGLTLDSAPSPCMCTRWLDKYHLSSEWYCIWNKTFIDIGHHPSPNNRIVLWFKDMLLKWWKFRLYKSVIIIIVLLHVLVLRPQLYCTVYKL